MSIRVSLCRMLRLIRDDTLRRVNNVDFLAGRLKCKIDFHRDMTEKLLKTAFNPNQSNHLCYTKIFIIKIKPADKVKLRKHKQDKQTKLTPR